MNFQPNLRQKGRKMRKVFNTKTISCAMISCAIAYTGFFHGEISSIEQLADFVLTTGIGTLFIGALWDICKAKFTC